MIVSCGGGSKSYSPVVPAVQTTVTMNSSIGGIANNATNTSTSPIIALTFSQTMVPSSLDANSISIVSANGSGIPITISNFIMNAIGNTVLFTSSAPLSNNTLYNVKVNNNAISVSGNKANSTNFSFTTGSQNSIQVAFINTVQAAAVVSLQPIFSVLFNMPVASGNAGAILLANVNNVNTPVGLTLISSDDSQMIYNFEPVSQLLVNTQYTLTFTPEIYSVKNPNNKLSNTSFNFTTGNAGVLPMVFFNNIFNNETGLSTSPLIQVQFNEGMNNLTSSNIVVVNTGNNNTLPISNISVSGSGNTYNIQLTGLATNTSYHLYFVGVSSVTGGIPLVNSGGDYFSTGNNNPSNPSVALVSPVNNSQVIASTVTSIVVQFDQPVDGVDSNSVKLYANNTSTTPLDMNITNTIGINNSYTITPSAPLPAGTTIIVALSNSIVSQNSNLPFSGTSLKFTTMANTNMQNLNAMTIAPDINGTKYMYIANYTAGTTVIVMCEVTENSQNQPILENCTNIPSPLSGNTWPVNITSLTYANINGNDYLYIAATEYSNINNTTMLNCILDNSGVVTSCSQVTNTVLNNNFSIDTTINIDPNNLLGYIASGTQAVQCPLDNNGNFPADPVASCTYTWVGMNGIVRGTTLYNSTLYTTGEAPGLLWEKCTTPPFTTQNTFQCNATSFVGNNYYQQIAVNSFGSSTFAYLSNNWNYNLSPNIYLFTLVNMDSPTGLMNAISDNSYSGTTPLTMLFDSVNGGTNNYIYISDYLSGHVYACAINSSSGQFSGCNIM